MHMKMPCDSCAGRTAEVHPHIHSLRGISSLDGRHCRPHRCPELRVLFVAQFVKLCDCSLRQHQQMARAVWVDVEQGEAGLAAPYYVGFFFGHLGALYVFKQRIGGAPGFFLHIACPPCGPKMLGSAHRRATKSSWMREIKSARGTSRSSLLPRELTPTLRAFMSSAPTTST